MSVIKRSHKVELYFHIFSCLHSTDGKHSSLWAETIQLVWLITFMQYIISSEWNCVHLLHCLLCCSPFKLHVIFRFWQWVMAKLPKVLGVTDVSVKLQLAISTGIRTSTLLKGPRSYPAYTLNSVSGTGHVWCMLSPLLRFRWLEVMCFIFIYLFFFFFLRFCVMCFIWCWNRWTWNVLRRPPVSAGIPWNIYLVYLKLPL